MGDLNAVVPQRGYKYKVEYEGAREEGEEYPGLRNTKITVWGDAIDETVTDYIRLKEKLKREAS
jgi:hypothetical protein